jgi:hypothetical protein
MSAPRGVARPPAEIRAESIPTASEPVRTAQLLRTRTVHDTVKEPGNHPHHWGESPKAEGSTVTRQAEA